MGYKHLTNNDRVVIHNLYYVLEMNISEIARTMKRNKSTISRELRRNSNDLGIYTIKTAQEKAERRFKNCHLMKPLKYKEFSLDFLALFDKKYMGVKATYMQLLNKEYEYRPSLRQMYNWIKSGRWYLTSQDRLKTWYKKGRKRHVGIFGDMRNKYIRPYWTRPNYINNREEFGHWELDLVVGVGNKNNYDHVLTFLERKTRMYFAIKVNSKLPYHINRKLLELIERENLIVKSITTDNGLEFENLGLIAKKLDIYIYKCEPYASYQKGSNENANGLLRRKYKKGTDFTLISDEELYNVTSLINTMPREMFNWSSSFDMYKEEMKHEKTELVIA